VNRAIDVERTFAAFVRSYGGEVVEDLVGASPAFPNADYLFRKVGVVAELKRLVEDKSEDAHMRAKINARFHRWMERGLVGPVWGHVQIQSRTLPLECQRELLSICAAPLKSLIQKANRQIKNTIDKLGIVSGKGLLIIVNEGNYLLEPEAALYLIGKVLGSRCRSVHSVIYLTVDLYAESDASSGPRLVWIHAARNSIPSVDYRFVDNLFTAWRAYLGKVTGQEIGFDKLVNREEVSKLKFRKRRPN
jgi:hypothetical protein